VALDDTALYCTDIAVTEQVTGVEEKGGGRTARAG
jgi:hypothetical protein